MLVIFYIYRVNLNLFYKFFFVVWHCEFCHQKSHFDGVAVRQVCSSIGFKPRQYNFDDHHRCFIRKDHADRRRRRLAGHLFQDRWEDQGRGFILLPPWPPNCLGQMLTVRDFSQHLVSSSKPIRPNIPRGARCMGHCEMM